MSLSFYFFYSYSILSLFYFCCCWTSQHNVIESATMMETFSDPDSDKYRNTKAQVKFQHRPGMNGRCMCQSGAVRSCCCLAATCVQLQLLLQLLVQEILLQQRLNQTTRHHPRSALSVSGVPLLPLQRLHPGQSVSEPHLQVSGAGRQSVGVFLRTQGRLNSLTSCSL